MGWAPVLSWGFLTFQDTREFSFFKSWLRAYPLATHQPPVTSEFEVFDETHLPVQVANEVQPHVDLDQLKNFTRLHIHILSPIHIETAQQAQPQDHHLQFTDLAVLALAHTLTHDLSLTDDLALRRALERQHFRPMGSVGVLIHAYKTNLIDRTQLDQAVEKLFTQSTLYRHPTALGEK